jgi:hypothetical protein
MKPVRVLLALGLLAANLAIARPGGENAWMPFTSKEGRFKALFPKKPTHLEQNETYDGKKFKAHFFLSSDAYGGVGVVYMDLPIGKMTKQHEKLALDAATLKMAESANSDVASSEDFTFGSYPAKSVLMQKKDGSYAQVYMILAGTRMYAILGAGPADRLTSPSYKKFFESFQITRG